MASSYGADPYAWPCAVASNMECRGYDELRADAGCQVKCAGSAGCERARRVCTLVAGCKGFSVNDQGTWATLKQHVSRPGRESSSGAALFCAPELKDRPKGPRCERDSPLCSVLSKVGRRALFSARLPGSLPPELPTVLGSPSSSCPVERQASATHIAYLASRYDSLPAHIALVADEGDEHAASGTNVCAQTLRLRAVAAALAGRPPPPSLLLSLSVNPPLIASPLNASSRPAAAAAAASAGSFRCAAQRRLGRDALLSRRHLFACGREPARPCGK